MVTFIMLDNSLSMSRPANPPPQQDSNQPGTPNPNDEMTIRSLALHGISCLLDHFEHHYRLEHVTVKAFADEMISLSNFTRDYAKIKCELYNIDVESRTKFYSNFEIAENEIYQEWSNTVPVHYIVVTDGDCGSGPGSLETEMLRRTKSNVLPLKHPGKISVLCINNIRNPFVQEAKHQYEAFFDRAGVEGQFLMPETGDLSYGSIDKMFNNLIERHYKHYVGTLFCGSEQSCVISLSPPPESYKKTRDFEIVSAEVEDKINVVGFLSLADVASPPVISRHLVLPVLNKQSENRTPDEDDGRVPNLCVFLHGALKVEGMCALVQVAKDWYGVLFSCADTKKKSNLMLSLFDHGRNPVAWLGDLGQLGPLADLNQTSQDPFPVKSNRKPSYSSSPVVWIRHSSLQSDIQKVLRHSKKLPEKTPHFYEELNRLKRAALSIGFHELLEGLASIFDRECTVLPGNAHPDCSMQLSHAAAELRSRECLNIDYQIAPWNTKFKRE